MFKKLQLVMIGVVVLQAAGVNASENKTQISPKTPRTPRTLLSCSKEARSDSGDFAPIIGLKRSLEVRKEERNNYVSCAYYPWPGGNPEFSSQVSIADQMKPWFPSHY